MRASQVTISEHWEIKTFDMDLYSMLCLRARI